MASGSVRMMMAGWLLLLFLFMSAPRTVFHKCAGHGAAEDAAGGAWRSSCSICGIPTPACETSLEVAVRFVRTAIVVDLVEPVASVRAGEVFGEYGRGPPALA